jgi:hypothetical protein
MSVAYGAHLVVYRGSCKIAVAGKEIIFAFFYYDFIGLMSIATSCLQLVQFLLKQAGVDKRTGDLYGNRDLLNIARNMARGLKVYTEVSLCSNVA